MPYLLNGITVVTDILNATQKCVDPNDKCDKWECEEFLKVFAGIDFCDAGRVPPRLRYRSWNSILKDVDLALKNRWLCRVLYGENG